MSRIKSIFPEATGYRQWATARNGEGSKLAEASALRGTFDLCNTYDRNSVEAEDVYSDPQILGGEMYYQYLL